MVGSVAWSVGLTRTLPRADLGCREAASTGAMETVRSLFTAQFVEVFGRRYPALHEPNAQPGAVRLRNRHDLHQRFARLGDNEGIPFTALSMSFERFVFASWMFTVCTVRLLA